MCCSEATVFSPENVSSESPGDELDSDSFRRTRPLPVEKLHVSNLDSSTDESMDQTEPRWVPACHSTVHSDCFVPSRGAECCYQSVCLSVRTQTYLQNYTSECHQIFGAGCLWQ